MGPFLIISFILLFFNKVYKTQLDNLIMIKTVIHGIIIFLLILPITSAEPAEIKTGIYVLNLGKFDIGTGSFTADFYFSFKCDNICPVFDFEFSNGRAATTDKIIDLPNEKFYRIQANLNSQIDLKKYPLDSQRLQIVIEDKKSTVDFVRFLPNIDESGIDKDIAFTGWIIKDWTAVETEHVYEVYDETYSRYVFTIPIERIALNSFLKTFLPVIFILLVMFSSYFLDPDKITTRLAMAGSALVASVMFHISISNQIPPVSYLTFADKFMILTYLMVLIAFVINVVMLELLERKKVDLVTRIYRATEYSSIAIALLLYAFLFIVAL